MTLEPLSNNEWPNDPMTHLAKSGSALRSKANERLSVLADVLPRVWRGVPVEYDINYESPDNQIRGYKMTDLMTTCLWVAVTQEFRTVQSMLRCMERGPTEEGLRIMEQTLQASEDKYNQKKTKPKVLPEKLIVLPGSNLILRRALDLDRMDGLVKDGAYIKPHPITNPLDQSKLKARYGADRILDPNSELYPLIRGAKELWVGANSESGLVAIMHQKKCSLIGPTGTFGENGSATKPTYIAFYKAMDMAPNKGLSSYEKMASLFSYPESGLVSIFHENPRERFLEFFRQYDDYNHGRE